MTRMQVWILRFPRPSETLLLTAIGVSITVCAASFHTTSHSLAARTGSPSARTQ